jgi:hypothetical protein
MFAFFACGGSDGGGNGGGGGGGSSGKWTRVANSTFATSEKILAIAFGSGTFVAGGAYQGTLAYSTGY